MGLPQRLLPLCGAALKLIRLLVCYRTLASYVCSNLVGGAASLRRYNHPMSASIPPARRELTQLSATETNALPEDLLRAILSYVSRSGVRELTVLPGRLYGLDASATAVGNGQRSLKSILRPLRSRVIRRTRAN